MQYIFGNGIKGKFILSRNRVVFLGDAETLEEGITPAEP